MATSEEVGRRIRDAREARGWTQAQLGQQLTRPRTHVAISDIERGRTKLNIDELSEFADVLGRPLGYFTGERTGSGVVYQRSDKEATPEQQRQNAAAVDSFKERMRRQFGPRAEGSKQ